VVEHRRHHTFLGVELDQNGTLDAVADFFFLSWEEAVIQALAVLLNTGPSEDPLRESELFLVLVKPFNFLHDRVGLTRLHVAANDYTRLTQGNHELWLLQIF